MNVNSTISVKTAIDMFTGIIRSLNAVDQQTFLSFIINEWEAEQLKFPSSLWDNADDDGHCDGMNSEEIQLLNIKRIVMDIRDRVPFDGVLPSESIEPPAKGENSDCDAKTTKHVDAFLYDNNEVDELIEEGKLKNYYCFDCGSDNVKEYNIISHSMSVSAMLYIFHTTLPCLKGKILLDIGSRLGAVLYGAHIFTTAKKIIGVEMNIELCKLQRDIVKKYKLDDRIEVVNKRIENCPEIVHNSDLIVMNNPFEFYVSESEHIEIWKFLRANTRKGTILVTIPHIETTFKDLETGITISKWLKHYKPQKSKEKSLVFGSIILDPEEHDNIQFYEVL